MSPADASVAARVERLTRVAEDRAANGDSDGAEEARQDAGRLRQFAEAARTIRGTIPAEWSEREVLAAAATIVGAALPRHKAGLVIEQDGHLASYQPLGAWLADREGGGPTWASDAAVSPADRVAYVLSSERTDDMPTTVYFAAPWPRVGDPGGRFVGPSTYSAAQLPDAVADAREVAQRRAAEGDATPVQVVRLAAQGEAERVVWPGVTE